MQFDPIQYSHADLTKQSIGAAMTVHRTLGPGLNEKIYENALCLELTAKSLGNTQQQQFPVFYRNQNIGNLITDLIVEERVIIEAKVVSAINEAHVAQTLSYPSISGLQVGLIINFNAASLAFKRVANIHLKNQ